MEINLEATLTPARLVKVWRTTVRRGLRRQAYADLHDFLDIHRNIKSIAKRLAMDVTAGHYRAKEPEVVRLEKKYGITRRLVLPSPVDAILLQALVETLEPLVKRHQPTDNAYYSRSHAAPSIEEVDETFAYPWPILWPQFQKRIWRFTEVHRYVIVADVANYFDAIPLINLRNLIASFGTFRENFLDLLFYLLETFTWRPNYIPLSGVGLPQLNFDAPRLMAHAYLFKADKYLHDQTGGDCVRWMDDINFGIDSHPDARRVLRELDELLVTCGLRINIGKTTILSPKEGAEFFWIQENRQLTVVNNLIKHGSDSPTSRMQFQEYLNRRFRRFFQARKQGYWSKVLKRYFTAFGYLKSTTLQRHVCNLLDDQPDVRENIFRYYLHLGYSARRFRHLRNYVRGGSCVDDFSLFQTARLITDWEIPARSQYVNEALRLAEAICENTGRSLSSNLAALWIYAKYGSGEGLLAFLKGTEETWTNSEWAARQVAAVAPRLDENGRRYVVDQLVKNGLLEGLRVLQHLIQLRALSSPDRQLRKYLLHPPDPPYPYPLGKVLLAVELMKGKMELRLKTDLKNEILRICTDPVLQGLLRSDRSRKV